jgi:putative pyruvate formate lyase activating enzyme
VVYNSSGYDSLHALTLMEGLVDVYLPDMKYGGDETARIYSGVANYVATSRAAVMEMFRQVGELTIDAHGVARSGLIIRHLVLPGGMADTMEVLQWIARHLPRSVHVSLMGQYQPAYEVDAGLFPEIDRKLTQDEYDFYVQIAQGLGLENLFIQSLSASADLNPDFDHPCPFG